MPHCLPLINKLHIFVFICFIKVILLVSPQLCAEIYAGGQWVHLDDSITSVSFSSEPFHYLDADYTALVLRLGKEFSGSLSGEVRYGTGLKEHYISPDLQMGIDRIAGVYLRYKAPLQYKLYPYAISGFSYIRSDRDGYELSDKGFSYGLGFDYHYSRRTIFNFEYLEYLDLQDSNIKSFAVGIVWKF